LTRGLRVDLLSAARLPGEWLPHEVRTAQNILTWITFHRRWNSLSKSAHTENEKI